VRDIASEVANILSIDKSEQETLLPSGANTILYSRTQWAITYLKKAGLLQSIQRGVQSITKEGKEFLEKYPTGFRVNQLKQIPIFINFYQSIRSKEISVSTILPEENAILSPDELLAETYITLRRNLAAEVLERVRAMSPSAFERLVVELLVRMGYGGSFKDAGRTTRLTNDEGIDGVIKEDKLGLDSIYLQAKRWKEGNVGRPEIQKFVGALAGQGAKKGVFITTSTFTKEAREYKPMNDTKIVLLDGEELADLMIDNNLGVSVHYSYEIKRMDNDYFEEI
ncbi:MAG: restriction endonuclease, partial [Candidatus Kapabacteria bacterium]|nr:restriction endonuclease [Candidatus Kapabacteria bacterium]